MNWKYEGTFLDQFNDYERNIVTQTFLEAFRGKPTCCANEYHGQAKNLTEMLDRLDREITFQSSREWLSLERRLVMAKLSTQLQSDDLKDFCRFVAKREKLPEADTQKLKEQQSKVYVQKAMSGKPPSEKQIKYLKEYGKEIPATMAEASKILDQCFNKGGKR